MTTATDIASFLAKFTPQVAAQLRASRRKVRALVPRGYELVFDNYNALVFGFSPTPKSSEAVLSLAVYPSWVTLFFLWGRRLSDPHHLLEGNGKQVRSIRLASPAQLDSAPVRALIRQALGAAPFDSAPKLSTVIKSVSAAQRPRRPKAEGAFERLPALSREDARDAATLREVVGVRRSRERAPRH